MTASHANAADDFHPTSEELERLALMSRSESWFLQNLQGPRELVDGQLLDPKLQYHFELRRKRSPEVVKAGRDLFYSAEGRLVARQALMREWALLTKVTAPMRAVEDRTIPGGRGDIPIRIYTPQAQDAGVLPLLVYFHGGGWIYSSIAAVDRCARLIANEARAIVISVEYGLAPENPWPAANDDGESAFLWAQANAAELGGSVDMIGVGGDSAGGRIALDICRRQIAAERPGPLYQLLYYTSGDFSSDHESHRQFGNGYGLDLAFFDFMRPLVFQGEATLATAAHQLAETRLKSMPATIVVTAGFDVLRDSGRNLARRLEREGVAVTYLNYPALAHGFLQWSGVVGDAERAAIDTARLFGTAIRSRLALVRVKAKHE